MVSKAYAHRQKKQFNYTKDRAPLRSMKRGFFVPCRKEQRHRTQRKG